MTLRQLFSLGRTVHWNRQYSAAATPPLDFPSLLKAANESRVLRLHRMPSEVQDHHICVRFEQYGSIERIVINPLGTDGSRSGSQARGRGFIIFEELDLAQKIIDSCRARNVSILIGTCPVLMKVVDTNLVSSLITGKSASDRPAIELPDALLMEPIPSRVDGAEISQLLAPYGTILQIHKRLHRHPGLWTARVSFAPGSTIQDFITDCAGAPGSDGRGCKVVLARSLLPLRTLPPALMIHYIPPHPDMPLSRPAAEQDVRNVLRALDINTDANHFILTKSHPIDNVSNFRHWILGSIDFTSFDKLDEAWDAMVAARGTITTPAGAWLSFTACAISNSNRILPRITERVPYDAPKKLKVPSRKEW
ncbi:hypothetical protein C8J56DRAFT_941163 [Mycena floridula]|nr:hypothetical protein C8J56DRAFT_941163 [Mycena floridula]